MALINFSNLQGDALEKVGHSRRVCNFLPRLKLNCFTSKRGKKRNFVDSNRKNKVVVFLNWNMRYKCKYRLVCHPDHLR